MWTGYGKNGINWDGEFQAASIQCLGAFSLLPKGVIILWYGTIASIPSGWALCNGSNGTPDLRNKFIVCANADSGGVAKTTLLGAAAQTGGSTSHGHGIAGTSTDVSGAGTTCWNTDAYASDQTTVPPFFALAYIMKL